MGADGFIQARFFAVHWFQNRDGRQRRGGRSGLAQSKRGGDSQQVIRGRRQCRSGPGDHNETRATPQITSNAPAQRSQLTRSRRTYLARIVSSTYVMAVTGTAKLSSATVSSSR